MSTTGARVDPTPRAAHDQAVERPRCGVGTISAAYSTNVGRNIAIVDGD